MRRAGAFSPGHITGFVEFPVLPEDPLLIGSRGAGFCIQRGVKTTVSAERSDGSEVVIIINGSRADDAEVSLYVVEEYLKLAGRNFRVRVEHDLQIPVGYGLGSSGAAALSLSLALNRALETGLSDLGAAQIAHRSDLACRCGVGTVLAEYHGGFEMRLRAGAPGIGTVEQIDAADRSAVILCLAPVSTKEFLTKKMSLINGLGGKMLHELVKTRSVDDFMGMSLDFARSIGFVSESTAKIIAEMNASGFRASVAMFGETVFSLVRGGEVGDARRILNGHGSKILVCDIDHQGARMIEC